MGSRETMILRIVLWLVNRYLCERYRLMSPEDLQKVVNDYLAELPKLGIQLVMQQPKVGEPHEQLSDSSASQQADGAHRVV